LSWGGPGVSESLSPKKKEDADVLNTMEASNFAEALGGNRSPPEEKIAKMSHIFPSLPSNGG
jgi:hypothetical protein